MNTPKYNLGDVIHYIKNNKPHSAGVLSIMVIDNQYEGEAYTKEQQDLYLKFGLGGVKYATCHGVFDEKEVYKSIVLEQ